MAEIELVIKIPEEQYNIILLSDKTAMAECASKEAMMYAIKHGTPLPKGHGRLIDADVLEKDIEDYSEGAFAMTPEFLVKDAPTIIEADKEREG